MDVNRPEPTKKVQTLPHGVPIGSLKYSKIRCLPCLNFSLSKIEVSLHRSKENILTEIVPVSVADPDPWNPYHFPGSV